MTSAFRRKLMQYLLDESVRQKQEALETVARKIGRIDEDDESFTYIAETVEAIQGDSPRFIPGPRVTDYVNSYRWGRIENRPTQSEEFLWKLLREIVEDQKDAMTGGSDGDS